MRRAFVRHAGTLSVALLLAVYGEPATAVSQPRPEPAAGSSGRAAAPRDSATSTALPDIAGLRPGVSLQDAYKRLKAYNPNAKIAVGQVQVPEIGDKAIPATLLFKSSVSPGREVPEIIQLELTLPPGTPLVWGILRRVFIQTGQERTRTGLLAELRRKYGSEDYGITVPVVNLHWLFDEKGQRAKIAGSTLANCALPGVWDITLNRSATAGTSSTFVGHSVLLDRPAPSQGPCKPMVYVKALLQPSGRGGLEAIEATTIAVIDGALAARAQASTAAYRANASETQKNRELKKTQRQPKPKS